MKRLVSGSALLLLIVVLTVTACSAQPVPVKSTPTAAPNRGNLAGEQIIATGQVTPIKSVALSFSTAGIVTRLPVALGDRVQASQVLAQLDTRQLELQVAQAEATLAQAQAKLNQLSHTPTSADVAAAQQNVVSAQAALTAAQQNYAAVQAGPTADRLAQLKAQADNAKAALDQAQSAYDKVGGASNPDIGRLPQSTQLQQATNNFNAALAGYNDARAHPTAAEVAAAESQIQQAQAAVQTAQTQLAKLQPSADDRAVLQASVNAAQAARDLAAEQLKSAQLVAPFAGTIETLDINAGEYVMPGTSVLHLADTSTWQVQTTDLTELNIASVQPGNPVTLTFDAIPGLQLSGKVTSVQPYGVSKQGDIDYTVVVTPDQQDPRLRWNMTAKVSIQTGQ